MNGNVHQNPGRIPPCFVWAGTVTWRSRSVQLILYLLQLGTFNINLPLTLRGLTPFPALTPGAVHASASRLFLGSPIHQYCVIFSTPTILFTFSAHKKPTQQPLYQCSSSSHPRLQTSYPFSACHYHSCLFPPFLYFWLFFYASCFLSRLVQSSPVKRRRSLCKRCQTSSVCKTADSDTVSTY